MSSKICVVIPAYNASETIKPVIKGALKHVSLVMVADDASTDNTAGLAAETGAEVLYINKNRGKGHALKMLFKKASDKGYDAAISMDADGQHNPKEIPLFMEAYNQHPNDLIIGSRMHEKEKIPRARYNSMHVARFYISIAANQFIEDTQCGFRLYPLSLIKNLQLTTGGYVTETEILVKAGDVGALTRPVKIGVVYSNNGSHFRPIKDFYAITAYLSFYLMIKWCKEGLSSDRPYTYSPNNICDRIGRHKTINSLLQFITFLTVLPATVLFLFEYLFFTPFIKNNFASTRRLNSGFSVITLATNMLPVLLITSIIEKVCGTIGFKVKLVDRLTERFYPFLWGSKKRE